MLKLKSQFENIFGGGIIVDKYYGPTVQAFLVFSKS